MSILDDRLAFDKEEDLRKAQEPEENYPENIPSSESKRASFLQPQGEKVLKKVRTSILVWAKCNYLKKGNAFFAGRIAELCEAACLKDIPLTISLDTDLIEFFCLPLKNPSVPQYIAVREADMI